MCILHNNYLAGGKLKMTIFEIPPNHKRARLHFFVVEDRQMLSLDPGSVPILSSLHHCGMWLPLTRATCRAAAGAYMQGFS